ncbi:pseudouridine synthase family protein [Desulfohalovibrio reitneri]|uniref:pseudouridine synthase family protein n=1 Tax=Desulfohalovibrio reitneri TaxID=1307759 RepID=UPI00110F6809|nr:RNA pseudouridine synthase [Desulfohalovibrio reitneri]
MKRTLIVQTEQAGSRLDRVLKELEPGMGLRGRRRLIREGRVLVDGRAGDPARKLQDGQVVEVLPGAPVEDLDGVFLVARTERFAALFKPQGVHTVSLAGGNEPNLEDVICDVLPGWRLCNRLDKATTGLVLAADSEASEADFRERENAGSVEKVYLAMVTGRLAENVEIDEALDVADRAVVRVLADMRAEPLRRTRVRPILRGKEWTLVEARIHKGARHQIRAHLAWLGHPILGDAVYGRGEEGGLRLHHARLTMEGFCAQADPPWKEWPGLAQRLAAK